MSLRALAQRSKPITIATTILLLIALAPTPGYALFGIGDIVFDPTSYATLGHIWEQDISNASKLVQTVVQLEKIYANGMQVYNLGVAMAKSFSGPNKAQWAAVAQMAVTDYTLDHYGEMRGWPNAVSGNPAQVPGVWKQATLAVDNGLNLAMETTGRSSSLARLASIEALDGSSQKCLATISQYRGNSLANTLGPILRLAIARADGTAATNSQIQQLNILAAEHEQGNTEIRAQGQIDACLVEQQILANKMQRDNQAEALNMRSGFDQTVSTTAMMPGNMAATITSYPDR